MSHDTCPKCKDRLFKLLNRMKEGFLHKDVSCRKCGFVMFSLKLEPIKKEETEQ